jgi:hypothetical protein
MIFKYFIIFGYTLFVLYKWNIWEWEFNRYFLENNYYLRIIKIFTKALLNLTVDFHFRHLLSAGVPGSLLGAFGACGVSPVPYSRKSQVPSVPINRLKNQQYSLTEPLRKTSENIKYCLKNRGFLDVYS